MSEAENIYYPPTLGDGGRQIFHSPYMVFEKHLCDIGMDLDVYLRRAMLGAIRYAFKMLRVDWDDAGNPPIKIVRHRRVKYQPRDGWSGEIVDGVYKGYFIMEVEVVK